VIGSTQLVQTLIEHDLVDEFRVMIDPVVLGGGKRILQQRRSAEATSARRRPRDDDGRDPRDIHSRRPPGR